MERAQCSNCDWTGDREDCNQIADLYQRVEPGEEMPAGECPECGCLAHKMDDEAGPDELIRVNLSAATWRTIQRALREAAALREEEADEGGWPKAEADMNRDVAANYRKALAALQEEIRG